MTDGLTDELIWGGLGNLRFLQVYFITSVRPSVRPSVISLLIFLRKIAQAQQIW